MAWHRLPLYPQIYEEAKMRVRPALRSIVHFLFKLLTHVEVEGLENVPRSGGAILSANHLGRLDSPLVFALLERDDATGLVADKYKKYILLRPLVDAVGGIWINREEADFQALRVARDYLQKGGMLGIAPEGTRSRTGALMHPKTGVAYLAHKAGVPILPVGITGTEKAVRELFRFQRPRLTVRFGKPFTLPTLERGERSVMLRANTDEIMCRIAALLPEEYRGVYKEHPRLRELLLEAK
jgi:1-acyl-sn-glycerol-3-phosphate acyltransferase